MAYEDPVAVAAEIARLTTAAPGAEPAAHAEPVTPGPVAGESITSVLAPVLNNMRERNNALRKDDPAAAARGDAELVQFEKDQRAALLADGFADPGPAVAPHLDPTSFGLAAAGTTAESYPAFQLSDLHDRSPDLALAVQAQGAAMAASLNMTVPRAEELMSAVAALGKNGGPRAMTDAGRQNLAINSKAMALRFAGSSEALATLQDQAKTLFNATDMPLGRDLANSLFALHDVRILAVVRNLVAAKSAYADAAKKGK